MRTTLGATAVALAAVAGLPSVPAAAQPGGAALRISRIATSGPPRAGENTFRVTVRNGSTTRPTPPGEPVLVKLTVRDPAQKEVEYRGEIRGGIGSNGSQTAAVSGVKLAEPGAYTVTAVAYLPARAGRSPIESPAKTQVFNLGGAAAAASYQLTVLARNQRNVPAHGVRVALKTADGRELDWKRAGGTGEARFPAVAPSPGGRPYTIEIRSGARVVGRFEFAMPAQNAVYEAKTELP